MPEKHPHEVKKSETALTEERVLARWREKKIFEKTLEKTRAGKPFVFYDGPPFATGEPHYGHILAGTIKDTIPRYQTMKGRYVRRQWGWDCHGLPVENIIEQDLNLSNKKDIEDYGVGNFNEAARRAVLRFDSYWKEIIPRLGRFIDMDLSYKTMDASYSESIWWAFKTLYDKGLVYEGHKIMYVCPRCETSLSNFEVAQGYKDVTDISVTAKFELVDELGTYLLAWTTTPWTLPGNTALAVNSGIKYRKVKFLDDYKSFKKDDSYIASEGFLSNELFGDISWPEEPGVTFPVEKKVPNTDKLVKILDYGYHQGTNLVGIRYNPLFDYYAGDSELENHKNGWKIYGADFVTTETGTGIVHIAPAFGEDDMNLARENNLPVVQHVSLDGKFKPEVKDFAGMYVKQKEDTQSADIAVIKHLAGKGTLFSKEKIVHSYPMCWRCETPLLNYAIGSWFVRVTEMRDKIVAENKKVGWVPAHIGEGRFGKWLEGARDWAISRSRYWGAPLPVWKCAECDKVSVFGSAAELAEKLPTSGNRYFMIRHGQSESNGSGLVNSDPVKEDHLTEKGKNQVFEAARKLQKDGIKIDRIISSDFMRTKETAETFAEVLGIPPEHIIFDPRIREIGTGVFHNKTNTEYHNFFSSYDEKFVKKPEGGETLMDVKHRVLSAIKDIEKTYHDETILIVTHEYTSWMLYSVANGFTNEAAIKVKEDRGNDFLKNAEVEELKFKLLPRNNDGELDFHRPYIDEVFFDCECGGLSRRIPDVFDCWFESGSMPYAQFHYPFENEKKFRNNFPADFIAEGVDQTRGWFYSLLVLSTGLFGESPYRNVIVNGIILAEDGQKMSKRLKNYPDPMEVVNKYGADALRYYLLSASIMRGEDLSFSEKGVGEVYKKNITRLKNVYAFYELYRGNEDGSDESKNILDRWILARLAELIAETSTAMDSYELDKAAKPIADFIEDFSTWYLRRSRDRFKGGDEADKLSALETTKYVFTELSKVIAPFMPFIADDLYLKVTKGGKEESVHLESWPEIEVGSEKLEVGKVLEDMKKTREVVTSALEARAKVGIKVRQPLLKLEVRSKKLENEYTGLIKDEVNVKEVVFDEKLENEVLLDTDITPELKEEGAARDLIRAIQEFRKSEGLTPSDKIVIEISAPEETIVLIRKHEEELKKVALLTDIKTVSSREISFTIL